MEYNFRKIEENWQQHWKDTGAYKVSNKSGKPKYYVLDMFPYPSGAGLHVGHPLGYIASDIYSRYKRLKGFNVLHPMGFDSFGLPAEQYALDTGQHPAETTRNNISTFKKQLDNIGFSFDWSREIKTSDPSYYKWTQWIFLQLFDSFFNRQTNKAEPITILVNAFESEGNGQYPCPGDPGLQFTADEWENFDEPRKMDVLMQYRLSYCGYGEVNWCEALGTVLANDEVINGVSERGGYPVVKKKLRQWYLRITEYADRLLEGLNRVDFSEAMKEMQTNWIGKSSGAEIDFYLTPGPSPSGEGGNASSPSPLKSIRTTDRSIWPILKELAREQRKNATEAEDILWQELRNNKLGHKVRRQHAIEGFIIDFAFLQESLLVEVDGEYHNDEQQKKYDDARTEFLTALGYKVMRFSNEQVITNKHAVLSKIREELERSQGGEKKTPLSSSRGLKEENNTPLSSSRGLKEENNTPLSSRRGGGGEVLRVYTTRPDTIFGVDFMVIAPEHEMVVQITTPGQKKAVDDYIAYVKSRSERERMAEKKISGVFTGAYALNPFDSREIPVWISEYVLAGYGTGAIMAVPCGDERDHKFANHFNIPITNIIGQHYTGEEANPTKDAILENSDFLNGIKMKDAIEIVINKIEELGIGKRKVNYKMRDAAFSRQRYWGEPFPIKWINGTAYPLPESELPLELPHVDSYKPGPEGEGPLANIESWTSKMLETNTMPGYAGSSWYFLRYMDPHNEQSFCERGASDYWGQVDVYIGGTEHAVGHLLYSRMWTKALYDLGYINHDEPYKKLVNQGMIQGSSRFVYRLERYSVPDHENVVQGQVFISKGIHDTLNFEGSGNKDSVSTARDKINKALGISRHNKFLPSNWVTSQLHVDVSLVDGFELDKDGFRKWREEYKNAVLICEDGSLSLPEGEGRGGAFICGAEVEKMSKSKFNTVNPDDLVAKYGADTFRMYEMFLGPVEMSKPWDTKGIEGVHRFLKKLWRLFFDELKGKVWNTDQPNNAEWKVLHKTIKQIEEVTERFSFNTAVSGFMIAVNELHDLKCYKKEILEQLLVLLTPYAPHIAEELWKQLGNNGSILDASFPKFEAKYVQESSKEYPVSINGKLRTTLTISLDATQTDVEDVVLQNDVVKKWLDGKAPKKIIYVKGKMVNVVV